MASVLLLDGFSEDSVYVDGKTPQDLENIFLPFLQSLLLYNGIDAEIFKQKGIEWDYKIIGKTDKNLIYLPIFSATDNVSSKISFIYTDTTAPESVSFRIASSIRRNCEEVDSEKVVFINALHERDNFKRYSPIIVDNLRISNESTEFLKTEEMLFKRAGIIAKSICEFYEGFFRKPQMWV